MNGTNTNKERAQELRAGVFVLIGLIFIATMAFKFGRLGQGLFQTYYSLTVTFPSADGLIKNSDVQLAGARVGYVAEKPEITSGGSGVTIPIKILSNVKIPRETTFEVASSGLLGDKFVDIKPKPDFDAASFNSNDPKQIFAPGEVIPGQSTGGLLGGLGNKADAVFDELKVEIKKLTEVTDKINNGILSQQNQQNITEIFANLKTTSERFTVASKDLDGAVTDAKTTIDSARSTLGTVNAAAGDVRTAIDHANGALDSAHALINKAQTGPGIIATLLNDRQISDNLRALVANLRDHGILFYKNKPASAATPAPAGRVQRQF